MSISDTPALILDIGLPIFASRTSVLLGQGEKYWLNPMIPTIFLCFAQVLPVFLPSCSRTEMLYQQQTSPQTKGVFDMNAEVNKIDTDITHADLSFKGMEHRATYSLTELLGGEA